MAAARTVSNLLEGLLLAGGYQPSTPDAGSCMALLLLLSPGDSTRDLDQTT